VRAHEVRLPRDMHGWTLIIPGGESTTIGKLMMTMACWILSVVSRAACGVGHLRRHDPDGQRNRAGSAGSGLMDISVERNAFGRQINSFEEPLKVDVLREGRGDRFRNFHSGAPPG